MLIALLCALEIRLARPTLHEALPISNTNILLPLLLMLVTVSTALTKRCSLTGQLQVSQRLPQILSLSWKNRKFKYSITSYIVWIIEFRAPTSA